MKIARSVSATLLGALLACAAMTVVAQTSAANTPAPGSEADRLRSEYGQYRANKVGERIAGSSSRPLPPLADDEDIAGQ